MKLSRKFCAKNTFLLWTYCLLSAVTITGAFVGLTHYPLIPRVNPSFSRRLHSTTNSRWGCPRISADFCSDVIVTDSKQAGQFNPPEDQLSFLIEDEVNTPESPAMESSLKQDGVTRRQQDIPDVYPNQRLHSSEWDTFFHQKRNHDDMTNHFSLRHHFVVAFSPPSFGLGSVLFQPKGLITKSVKGEQQMLRDASDFFVDAFWVGKVGGGPKQLNDRQRRSLTSTQFMEFRSRYAGATRGQSELVVCQLPDGEVIGCAGIEVTPIPDGNLKAESKKRAPLMSNLAVSRNYRRKGIGELLVKEAERIARFEWGANDCYLYVERRNTAAVKLYQKLGYREEWIDKDAKTLIPTSNGNLQNEPTEIVCMRKRLNAGIFGQLWPF